MNLKLKVMTIAGLGAVLMTPHFSQAQPPGGRPRGAGGPGGWRGGPMGPRRDDAKRRLGGLWRGLGHLQGATALSKPQAIRIVGLMNPWMSRPKMTDAQAKTLVVSLESVLTPAQRTAARPRGGPPDGRRGWRPDGPPPGGRPDGPPPGGRPDGPPPGGGDFGPPPGGGRPPGHDGGPPPGGGPPGGGFDPARFQAMRGFMETMNPFYPPTEYKELKNVPERMKQGMNRRYAESRATLTALSRKAK